MYHRFDAALADALNSEYPLYGGSDRSIATAAARRESTENRVKAMNEATLGKVSFAAMHDTACLRYHEDAELMASGKPPLNHSISFYLSTAEVHRKADAEKVEPIAAPRPVRVKTARRAA